jgi:hypothetical protein
VRLGGWCGGEGVGTGDLYEADILVWSERQADLLRRIGAGQWRNETPDWAHIAEEIEDVGRAQFNAVQSHLRLAMLNLLKIRAWSNARDVEHWREEVANHRSDAADAFSPSMRQRLDLAKLYRRAVKALVRTNDGVPREQESPEECPSSLGTSTAG